VHSLHPPETNKIDVAHAYEVLHGEESIVFMDPAQLYSLFAEGQLGKAQEIVNADNNSGNGCAVIAANAPRTCKARP
jgi:hypothetical protein